MNAYAHNPSASRRLSAFVLFVIGVTLTVGLFYIKTRAQTANEAVVKLERAIDSETRAVAVLEAEIAFRERPGRLADLSKKNLGFEPISTKTTLTVEQLAETFPLKDELNQTAGEAEVSE